MFQRPPSSRLRTASDWITDTGLMLHAWFLTTNYPIDVSIELGLPASITAWIAHDDTYRNLSCAPELDDLNNTNRTSISRSWSPKVKKIPRRRRRCGHWPQSQPHHAVPFRLPLWHSMIRWSMIFCWHNPWQLTVISRLIRKGLTFYFWRNHLSQRKKWVKFAVKFLRWCVV